mmetsp:Transcript_54689/g.176910  ORF Transcript_54689/g.176910 Transcript_54689/m.176910 type:complete len:216 (+) Transcript_54689:93-740(+)
MVCNGHTPRTTTGARSASGAAATAANPRCPPLVTVGQLASSRPGAPMHPPRWAVSVAAPAAGSPATAPRSRPRAPSAAATGFARSAAATRCAAASPPRRRRRARRRPRGSRPKAPKQADPDHAQRPQAGQRPTEDRFGGRCGAGPFSSTRAPDGWRRRSHRRSCSARPADPRPPRLASSSRPAGANSWRRSPRPAAGSAPVVKHRLAQQAWRATL